MRPSLAPAKALADMVAGKELGCSPHTSSWRAEGAEVTFWPEWLVPFAAKLVTMAEKQHSSMMAGDWKPLLLGRNQCSRHMNWPPLTLPVPTCPQLMR